MRETRRYTRVAVCLIATAAIAATTGQANAAIDVAGVPVPEVPTSPALPPPVNDAIGTVNDTVGGVADTVGGVTSPATDPVTDAVDQTTKPPAGPAPSGSPQPSAPGTATPPTGGGDPAAPDAGRGERGGGPGAGRPATRARRGVARRDRRGGSGRPASAGRTRAGRDTIPAPATGERDGGSTASNPIAQVIERIQEVIPTPIKILIAVLALLALGSAGRARVAGRRARRLEHQRQELLGDVGLLQRALLPDVPADLPGIDASVAYRPAEGPAAGGDFYDVFELDGGRTAIIVGDVCGHGRAALAVTALMRYTLRAYLGVGLEPRVALKVAARALDGHPDGALTTVVLAVYDPAAGTLTYACAGHEPPIVLGPASYEPVTTFSSPPLGGFMPTGQRQTIVPLPPGSAVCFFTDGLVEARLGDAMVGRGRLTEMLGDLAPDAGAQLLLERLAQAADRAPDDMAACLVRTRDTATASPAPRVEELEVEPGDLEGDRVAGFLIACGVDATAATGALRSAHARTAEFGGALIRVAAETGTRRVEVLPREDPAVQLPSLDEARKAGYGASPSVSIS